MPSNRSPHDYRSVLPDFRALLRSASAPMRIATAIRVIMILPFAPIFLLLSMGLRLVRGRGFTNLILFAHRAYCWFRYRDKLARLEAHIEFIEPRIDEAQRELKTIRADAASYSAGFKTLRRADKVGDIGARRTIFMIFFQLLTPVVAWVAAYLLWNGATTYGIGLFLTAWWLTEVEARSGHNAIVKLHRDHLAEIRATEGAPSSITDELD